MGFKNELQRVPLLRDDRREVAGLVRVRGIDARAGQQGFVALNETPVAVVVREGATERKIPLAQREPPFAALAAAPVAAFVAMKLLMRRKR
jgi:hypothetical protein